MQPFRAFRIHQENGRIVPRIETITLDQLNAGEVIVKVHYSAINYKDALAATGAGKILRRYPLVGGIDLAGEVVSSAHPGLTPGQPVLVTGCGLSETHDGGYAEYARVQADWIIPVPAPLTTFEAMAIGTAGFTAALAIHTMEHNGQSPENGEVVVTGATGGVGSFAIDMLARRGYSVAAITGKQDSRDYLEKLGAQRVLLRSDITFGQRPLETALWAGAVDNVGGDLLAWLTRTTRIAGNIASIGNAGGVELHTTVMPFILRGVNLLGINTVFTPRALRMAVWSRLAGDLKPRHLAEVARTIPFAALPDAFAALIQSQHVGRTVVQIA